MWIYAVTFVHPHCSSPQSWTSHSIIIVVPHCSFWYAYSTFHMLPWLLCLCIPLYVILLFKLSWSRSQLVTMCIYCLIWAINNSFIKGRARVIPQIVCAAAIVVFLFTHPAVSVRSSLMARFYLRMRLVRNWDGKKALSFFSFFFPCLFFYSFPFSWIIK